MEGDGGEGGGDRKEKQTGRRWGSRRERGVFTYNSIVPSGGVAAARESSQDNCGHRCSLILWKVWAPYCFLQLKCIQLKQELKIYLEDYFSKGPRGLER